MGVYKIHTDETKTKHREKLYNSSEMYWELYNGSVSVKQNKVKYELLTITIMGKVSKETKREQRYNANLHNIFVKAQEEIANK